MTAIQAASLQGFAVVKMPLQFWHASVNANAGVSESLGIGLGRRGNSPFFLTNRYSPVAAVFICDAIGLPLRHGFFAPKLMRVTFDASVEGVAEVAGEF
jgi:hypothetical protein